MLFVKSFYLKITLIMEFIFGMFIMILYLVNETSLIWKMVFSNYEMGTHLTG